MRELPANERWRYFVTTSLIGWVQAQIQPCRCVNSARDDSFECKSINNHDMRMAAIFLCSTWRDEDVRGMADGGLGGSCEITTEKETWF